MDFPSFPFIREARIVCNEPIIALRPLVQMTTKNDWTDINWPLLRVWVYKCLKTNSMDSPFNLPACSLFQLSGRKVNILPSYVIFHFVNVDIPRLCDISFFFFLLEFLKYISQHCTIQDLTSDYATRRTSTIVLFF